VPIGWNVTQSTFLPAKTSKSGGGLPQRQQSGKPLPLFFTKS